jgi:hypothetical protein
VDSGFQSASLQMISLDGSCVRPMLPQHEPNRQEDQMKRRLEVAGAVAVFLIGVSVVALHANVLLRFSPDEGGGVPAYARIELGLVHHTADWAAIAFYRDPGCVPPDFNLLDFFDAPRAFECTLTVEGFEIWRNGPWAGDAGPIQTVSAGLGAVPVWFVRWDELEEAIDDDSLTIDELAALPSLRIGSAASFRETLHPYGNANQTKTQIVAEGTWNDESNGGMFFFQVEETHNQLKHVMIEFR